MILRRGVFGLVLVLEVLVAACYSDRPEPADAEVPAAGLHIRITRVATHPFLSRYNLTLRVERPGGCVATADLFPDTGYTGRRNLYRHVSGAVAVVGQYDVRVIEAGGCAIRLIEFRAWDRQAEFIGSFDVGADKRWRFIPPTVRPELPFETL